MLWRRKRNKLCIYSIQPGHLEAERNEIPFLKGFVDGDVKRQELRLTASCDDGRNIVGQSQQLAGRLGLMAREAVENEEASFLLRLWKEDVLRPAHHQALVHPAFRLDADDQTCWSIFSSHFPLKMIMGGRVWPAAMTASITVRLQLSEAVVWTRINLRPLTSIVRLGDELEVEWGLVHVDDHFVVELVALSLYEFMEAGDLVLLGRRCAIDVMSHMVAQILRNTHYRYVAWRIKHDAFEHWHRVWLLVLDVSWFAQLAFWEWTWAGVTSSSWWVVGPRRWRNA